MKNMTATTAPVPERTALVENFMSGVVHVASQYAGKRWIVMECNGQAVDTVVLADAGAVVTCKRCAKKLAEGRITLTEAA